MKNFRVNRVSQCAPEELAALVRAQNMKSAVRKVKGGRDLRLPDGTYYIFEAGHYNRGLSMTLPSKEYQNEEQGRKTPC